MIAIRRRARAVAALVVALAVLVVAVPGVRVAADPEGTAPVDVDGRLDDLAVRQIVEVRMAADGEPERGRLLTQLAASGQGRATVTVPTRTDDLRALDGFTRPRVGDDEVVWDLELDGLVTRRTVADWDEPAGVDLVPTYELDGEEVGPDELVGATGELRITYDVRNRTGETVAITYEDAEGEVVDEEVAAVVPMAASLRLDLPATWEEVEAERAAVTGDERGTTTVTWTMPLFEPLGEASRELEVTARLDGDGLAPAATLQAVPLPSSRLPQLGAGLEQAEEAAEALGGIAEGGVELDEALLELAAGMGELLAGVRELAAGAGQLASGLDEAARESAPLEGGAREAAEGGRELAAGLGQLAGGAGELAGGVDRAADGGDDLADGAEGLAAGLAELAEAISMLRDGAEALADGTGLLADELPLAAEGARLIADAVDEVEGQLGGLVDQLDGHVDDQEDLVAQLGDELDCDAQPQACQLLDDLADSLAAERTLLAIAAAGLDELADELVPAAEELADGLEEAVDGADEIDAGAAELADGLATIDDELDALVAGVADLADGADQLASGLDQLEGGAHELAGASRRAAEGTGELAGGLADLAGGVGMLRGGLREAALGAGELADGAGMLADGVDEAGTGVSELQRQGTGPLRIGLVGADAEQARELARLEALDERLAVDGMAVGAPEHAAASTVYLLHLAGEDGGAEAGFARGVGAIAGSVAIILAAGLLGRRGLLA